MAHITIDKIESGELTATPVYEDLQRRLETVRRRAFELYKMRGCEPGGEVEDWLEAEREVLGWPPLETQETDREFEFQVPLGDYDVNEVEIVVTPSEIIVHAKTNAEQMTDDSGPASVASASRHLYRRIELAELIKVEETRAMYDSGTLRITAAKAAAKQSASMTA
jgi:HSP20 family molecular chaperone IbpA